MIRGVYLRCNGEMACYCGPGEEIVLGKLPLDKTQYNFVEDFYNNKRHKYIRSCMANNVLPYPGVCLKCIYLEPHFFLQTEAVEKEIEWMHIEATSQCNLDCLFCIPLSERRSFRSKPHFLPFKMYEKVVDDIAAHEMSVKWMYFSGRGEPGIHRQVWDMVNLAKERLNTNFLVNTNGNIPYSDLIVDSGLDKIKIAIDGSDQQTYENYRRGGKLERVLKLTRQIAERKRTQGLSTPKIIWQYILFSHNDSLAALTRIQEMALDYGVDEILFKSTFTHNYSSLDLESIPNIYPNTVFMDIKGMVTISQSELDEEFVRLEQSKREADWDTVIPLGIDISKKIFRHFILGIEKKQLYNEYGKSDDVSVMIELARSHGQEFKALLGQLRHCFLTLIRAYEETNRHKASIYYHRFEEKLQQAGIEI